MARARSRRRGGECVACGGGSGDRSIAAGFPVRVNVDVRKSTLTCTRLGLVRLSWLLLFIQFLQLTCMLSGFTNGIGVRPNLPRLVACPPSCVR